MPTLPVEAANTEHPEPVEDRRVPQAGKLGKDVKVLRLEAVRNRQQHRGILIIPAPIDPL